MVLLDLTGEAGAAEGDDKHSSCCLSDLDIVAVVLLVGELLELAAEYEDVLHGVGCHLDIHV